MNEQTAPVGMFDSGVGGLSVLGEAVRQLPGEDFIYFGDTANAPYGVRSREDVQRLAFAAVDRLLKAGAKAVVIACNTATAEAAAELRAHYRVPIIGMEPALKPAALLDRAGLRLVMATPGTLQSQKYARLYAQYGQDAVSLPCPGLMEFVERGDRHSEALRDYLINLFAPYRQTPIAAVVLGCTHYSFIRPFISTLLPVGTSILDGNAGTIRQLRRRLEECELLNPGHAGRVTLGTSGGSEAMCLMRQMFEEAKRL